MSLSNYGVCVMANDRMINWFLPFLHSYYEYHSNLPLYVIPYDKNLKYTYKAANYFGAQVLEERLFSELDYWARCIYPWAWKKWRRLRKIASLLLPLDEVIYIDVDTLILNDFSQLFGYVSQGVCDFLIASISPDSVYCPAYQNSDRFKDTFLFSDGFFLTSQSRLTWNDFYELSPDDRLLFHRMRKRGGLIAQPLMNFVVHHKNLNIAQLSDCLPHASNESFYKAEGFTFVDRKVYCQSGRELFFVHWAGGWKSLPTGKHLIDEFWLRHQRLVQKKIF